MSVKTSEYKVSMRPVGNSDKHYYQQCLYHQYNYLSGQSKLPEYCFGLDYPGKREVHGTMYFYRKDNQAISQRFAPFGSYDGVSVSNEIAEEFMSIVIRSLCQQGINKIEIKQPATCYPDTRVWGEVFLKLGFKVRKTVNHHLRINHLPFSEKLHHMERRKLTKSGGFQFMVHSNHSLPDIYQFIKNCRDERGQSLSMNYQQLHRVVSCVPDKFLLCTANYAHHIAAAAVVIKTSHYSWYQFYPAHSLKFNKYSPMVFLLSGLYNLAGNEGVKMLDLGTSEFEGKPLEGLLKFKSRVGGERSFKEVYTKTL